jgi:hypothetical protein
MLMINKANTLNMLVRPVLGAPPEVVRGFIMSIEEAIRNHPMSSDRAVAFSELEHTFAGGVCARTIHVRAGALLTTEIHKYEHHVSVLKGRVSVFSEFGIEEVSAPCSFVSPAGIKRVCFIHEDTIWTTYHATEETDPDKIVAEATVGSYEEIGVECVRVPSEIAEVIQ